MGVLLTFSIANMGASSGREVRYVHAAVPGSSEPSGQSQYSSLSCEVRSLMDGFEMQWKYSGSL